MNRAPADVLILPMTEDLSPAISLATKLRQAGIRTQLYSEQKKFKGKMSYADKLHNPYVAFLGEDSISVVVSAMENGMTDADAARIGEIVKEQTGLNADQIKIIEAE